MPLPDTARTSLEFATAKAISPAKQVPGTRTLAERSTRALQEIMKRRQRERLAT
jgi:hypothetical protein